MINFFLILTLLTPETVDAGPPSVNPASPETFLKPGIEEPVYRYQMDMLRSDGGLPPAAPCICRAKFKLKETPPCADIRKKKKGKTK